MENAFISGILASIISGIVGVYVVTKRIVFISAGISHISFGGIGIAYYFGQPPFLGAVIFAIVAAFTLGRLEDDKSKRYDSAIGILWASGMAIGILFIHLTEGYAPDLSTYLFGSILFVSKSDIYIMTIIVILLLLVFVFFYREILSTAFDKEFSIVCGLPVRFINVITDIIIALTIVVLIEIVGILLVIALLTVPPSIAGLITRSLKALVILSTAISLFMIVGGLLISYFFELSSGVAIILPGTLILLIIRIFYRYR